MTASALSSPSSSLSLPQLSPEEVTLILDTLRDALVSAGELLREELYRPEGPRGSDDHADVDTEAETLIRDIITRAFPEHDLVGEELGSLHNTSPFQWQVDPNDGTSAFLKGYRGSAVSIGLLYEGEPIAGGVYAFAYPHDQGDLIMGGLPELFGGVTRSGVLCPPPAPPASDDEALIAISQGADRSAEANIQQLSPSRYLSVPSIAYRLALVAVGDAHAGISTQFPTTWDLVGGHALLRAQGLELFQVSADGGAQVYQANRGGSPRGTYIGGHARLCSRLAGLNLKRPRNSPDAEGTNRPFSLCGPLQVKRASSRGELLARAQGAILGMMSGDSLGSLVEFQSPERISSAYPEGVRAMRDGGTFNKLAGQVTDDSEMALALARSILDGRGYSQERAARGYALWRASNPFDIGNTTIQALNPALRALSGEVVEGEARVAEVAQRHASLDSEANGALMRITPLAVWGVGTGLNTDELAEFARLDSKITHPNRVCQDANAVFVVALKTALLGASPRGVYDTALEWARTNVVEDSVMERLVAAETEAPSSGRGWVLNAFQAAFYSLLRHQPEEGIVWSISLGADTDTNAAITGALLGATHGIDALPQEWILATLTSRPSMGFSRGRCIRPKWLWSCDALLLTEKLLHPL